MGIHNYERRLERTLNRIKSSDIPEKDKEALLEFKDQCLLNISTSRTMRYLQSLKKVDKMSEFKLKGASKPEIKRVVAKIKRKEDFSPWTKQMYRVALRKFYQFQEGYEWNQKYPEKVDWISITVKKNHKKLPGEILSKDDIKALIKAAKNPRDRAFVAALYESGCRIGEFGTLKLKHVKFDDYGAKLIVNGKTGSRRVRLISSVPYLKEWLENYPKEKDPENHLWVNLGVRRYHEEMKYGGMRQLLVRLAKRAGIKKPVNPHNFRHSRATHLANHLTEAQMCEYFGWVQGSDQPATYVHLSGRDLDNKLLQIYGKKKKDDNGEEDMKPRVCLRCEHENGPTNKFCAKCGMPLEPKIAQEIGDKKEGVNKLMKKLLKDPEVKKMLLEKISEKELDLE